MMAAQVSAQPGFVVNKPQLLFAGQYEPAQLTRANYDVSADGQRFLMVKSSEEQAGTQVNIVLNWFES